MYVIHGTLSECVHFLYWFVFMRMSCVVLYRVCAMCAVWAFSSIKGNRTAICIEGCVGEPIFLSKWLLIIARK